MLPRRDGLRLAAASAAAPFIAIGLAGTARAQTAYAVLPSPAGWVVRPFANDAVALAPSLFTANRDRILNFLRSYSADRMLSEFRANADRVWARAPFTAKGLRVRAVEDVSAAWVDAGRMTGKLRQVLHEFAAGSAAEALAALDDVDREIAALRGRLLSEEQAAELSDGTGLVRPLLTTDTSESEK